MSVHSHTTTHTGFDYMANTGQEAQDRDACGILLALAIMVLLTLCQYFGLY